ncbi:hypothetical protein L0B62_001038 [Staphylococcus pseudintermedius]|nr:hypothetical protein [Staphylococcus pseudintermedius]
MRKEHVIENGKFIFSENENSFKEVLDSFKIANEIIITTYNVSKSDDSLIQSLKDLNQNQHVKLFTNIPGRFDYYFKSNYKSQAKKIINNYIEKLDPKSFNCNLEVYFSFSNHSKIIATDSVAYIGSANFSSESKNNFEAGVLFKDEHFMNYLNKEVLPGLTKKSFEYYLKEEVENVSLVYYYLETIKKASEELSDSFYMPIEVAGRTIGKSFRLKFLDGSLVNMNTFEYYLSEIENLLNCFLEDMVICEDYEDSYIEAESILSALNIIDILQLIDENSDLYKFINNSEEKFIEDAIQSEMENYGEIDPDSLNDHAHEMLSGFLKDKEEEIEKVMLMFEYQISKLYQDINKFLDLLPINMKTNRTLNPHIDNT